MPFGNSGSESQRDSATKPRVARNELPWENAPHIGDNPERVVADDNGNKTMPQPLWLKGLRLGARQFRAATTPLGLNAIWRYTQGSSFLATLGFVAQSLW